MASFSGNSNITGYYNTFLGPGSGYYNTTGVYNTFVGYYSGHDNTTGSSNVFLGYAAGRYETGSNKLYIENSHSLSPLIYGDFDADFVTINGDLTVNGTIRVTNTVLVPDYVFEPGYRLRSLEEVKRFIDANGHLPEIPSAAEVAQQGLDMAGMQMRLLRKVEELTLYTMQQQEKIHRQQ